MIPLDFHFLSPHSLLLILACPICFILFWYLYRYRQNIVLMSEMVQLRSPSIYWFKVATFCLAVCFSIIALMQPVGNAQYPESALHLQDKHKQNLKVELKRKAHDVFILIDVSSSMSVTDARLNKTRLQAAQNIADEIISQLTGESVGLYTFTSDLDQISPLTLDSLFVRLMLKEIQINENGVPGTDIGNSLYDFFENYYSTESVRMKSLILLSDGEDNTLTSLPEDQKRTRVASIVELFQKQKGLPWHVYTIGTGSLTGGLVPDVTFEGKPVTSKLEEFLLKSLSQGGKGHYYSANDFTASELAHTILKEMSKEPPYYENTEKEIQSAILKNFIGDKDLFYTHYFQIPIALASLLLILFLFLPDQTNAMRLMIAFIFLTESMYADDNSLNQANAIAKSFVEAKMYEDALVIYQKLLHTSLIGKEKAAITYNIGTIYLLQNAWEKSIKELSAIESKNAASFLQEYIHKNLALAFFEKGKEENNPIAAKEEFHRALKEVASLPKEMQQPLKSALESAINEAEPQAKQMVEQAITGLHSLDTQKIHQSNSTELLKLLIEQQQYLLWLTLEELFTSSDQFRQMASFLQQRQTFLIEISDQYFLVLDAEQKQNYASNICQSTPWAQALPHVSLGDDFAIQASLLLQINEPLQQVVIEQKSALQEWQAALDEIESPRTQSNSCLTESSYAESFKTLIKMQINDLPTPVISPPKKSVLKPW